MLIIQVQCIFYKFIYPESEPVLLAGDTSERRSLTRITHQITHQPANDSCLARIQDCPNSHITKTNDNCDIGVFSLVLGVSFHMKVISSS